jgi:hypothetical protein
MMSAFCMASNTGWKSSSLVLQRLSLLRLHTLHSRQPLMVLSRSEITS